MSSIITGYNYDIFISYRQKDNKYDGWVTEFVDNLKKELEATFKEDISLYFDINPHDGLLETHDVDASLKDKLKCVVFIPIISKTYCDPKSFAWEHEFKAFIEQASEDQFGLKVKLPNGNVASRILPIQIHDLYPEDKAIIEKEMGGVLRAIEFIYKEPGVNKPLTDGDDDKKNLNNTKYRIQVNKVANAIDEIIHCLKGKEPAYTDSKVSVKKTDYVKTSEGSKDEQGTLKPAIKSKKWLIIALSLVICIVGVFAIYKVISSGKQADNVSKLDKSIAVLPFVNDSPDAENEYFCNGMMEDILNYLVKINDLNVKSRTDVEPYRESSKSLKEIGKELGVANILEGSVRKQGNRFKISIQLIKADNGFHLWSETYEGEYSDEIFSVQSNIAQQVAKLLKTVLTREEKEEMENVGTTDIRAYDFTIRGRYELLAYWKNRDRNHLAEAERLVNEALKIDPEYVNAIRWKAGVFLGQGKWDSVLVYSNRLLDNKSTAGYGYHLKREYYRFTNVPDPAIENYLLAIKYLPKHENQFIQQSIFFIGDIYCLQKRDYQKGLPYLQKGMEIEDEHMWGKYYMFAIIFQDIGDYARSNKYYQKSLELDVNPPTISYYSMSLLAQSKFREALNFLDTVCRKPESLRTCNQYRYVIYYTQKEFKLGNQHYNQYLNVGGTPSVRDSIWIAYMYKETGKEQASLAILKNCQKYLESQLTKTQNSGLYINLSSTFALLDQKEESLKYLSKVGDFGFPNAVDDYAGICPLFESLWDDPEFKAIIKRSHDEKAKIRAQVKEMVLRGEIDL